VLLLVLLQEGQQQGGLRLTGCPLQFDEGPRSCSERVAAAAAGCVAQHQQHLTSKRLHMKSNRVSNIRFSVRTLKELDVGVTAGSKAAPAALAWPVPAHYKEATCSVLDMHSTNRYTPNEAVRVAHACELCVSQLATCQL
jgi:hypothetical protein